MRTLGLAPRRSGARVHGRKAIERFLVHLPVRHEFDARIILDQIVERLAGFRFQMLQQIFRLSHASRGAA